MSTNLPIENTQARGAEKTKLYFDEYGQRPIELSASELDRVVGFFSVRGFDQDAAYTTAITLLRRAKVDRISVSSLIDSLTGFTDLQISRVIAEILNNDRKLTSVLGFKVDSSKTELLSRNIIP
jgi:hypothetical protein